LGSRGLVITAQVGGRRRVGRRRGGAVVAAGVGRRCRVGVRGRCQTRRGNFVRLAGQGGRAACSEGVVIRQRGGGVGVGDWGSRGRLRRSSPRRGLGRARRRWCGGGVRYCRGGLVVVAQVGRRRSVCRSRRRAVVAASIGGCCRVGIRGRCQTRRGNFVHLAG